MPFKGFLSIVVLLTSTLFTQTQLLRLSENCRKEKWLLSANDRGKNTLATRQLPAGRTVRKRKVASFCEYQGKEYTCGLPEELLGKEK